LPLAEVREMRQAVANHLDLGVRKEYIRTGYGEPQVEYELGGATEQLSKYGPHEITVACKRRGEQVHGVVLEELERPEAGPIREQRADRGAGSWGAEGTGYARGVSMSSI
jgi:hypothetical protein